MEDLIAAFGIDGRLIVIQIVNFAILAGLLWYFLYEPILKLLEERKQKAIQGIEDAEEAARARSDAEEEKKEILGKAAAEAEGAILRATESAKREGSEIVKSAETKAEQMVEAAKKRGQELEAEALRASEAEIARSAVLAAEKILRSR